MPVFMNDPATGRFALYDEAPGGGDVTNPNSMRNRPLNSPQDWLPNIYFHSDFNYLEVASGPITISVSHTAVTPGTKPPEATINFGWVSSVTDRLLFTHNLGYTPTVMCALGNNILWPGMPVQSTSGSGQRFATVYSTTTQVRMKEFAATGTTALPAATLSYTLLVFANPPSTSGNILYDFDPLTGVTQMGRGKFNSSRRYLQVVSGGTPFGVSYGGKTIDLQNGAPRAVRPDGTTFNPVPSDLGLALPRVGLNGTNYGVQYGGSMGYTGSYTGPGNIQVQAP